MDTLFLYNTKTLKEKFKTKVFAGDNHITKINVQIPDNIGGYPKRECEFNLRAIIPEGNLSYIINPNEPYFYITNDITEKAQTVKLMMIITHEGNVIGRTNTVDLVVNEPAEAPDPPLTPREEFDEVIAEQRAEIAEQAETISTQGETITQQGEQITELSGEVSELESTVTEQQATITRQNTTIDELNERRTPVYIPAQLESKLITPKDTTEYYSPSEGKDGFSAVTVEGATVEALGLNENYYKINEPFLDKVGKYNPFPENTYGGIYFTELDENNFPVGIKMINYDGNGYTLQNFYGIDGTLLQSKIKSFEIVNCRNIAIATLFMNNSPFLKRIVLDGVTAIGAQVFRNCNTLTDLVLSEPLMAIDAWSFQDLPLLKTLNIPNSLITLTPYGFLGGCVQLQYVTIENGFNCNNLNLSASTLYSVETIVSWLEALADRTGETAYTLTMGTTNLNKLTNEQKAIATNKNWNLA